MNLNKLSAQTYWLDKGGSGSVDEGMDIAVDANGNTYATGYFSGTVTFGVSSYAVSLKSSGVTDIYVVKINASGIVQWAEKAGGAGSDRGLSITVDANGNSYVTGYYQGKASFGSTTLNANSGSQDVFVAKYNTSGVLQWVRSAGGSNVDMGNGIAVDNSGNVIVTGQFQETANFGNLSLTSVKNPSSQLSSIDVFTLKYDNTGKELWVKQGAAPYTDRGLDIACDPSGNIYVTGQFSDTITFDVTHNNNAFNAIFLIKYNSGGTEQWFRRIGGGTQNIAYGVAVDASSNVYLTGDFISNLIFFATPTNSVLANSSYNSIFIAKYNSGGTLQWAEDDTSSSEVSARNITIDNKGNPFVIGNFKCKFSEYAKEYGDGTFNSIGYHDVFTVKYDANGKRQWAQQFGGQSEDAGYGIASDNSGQIYTTGSFNNRIFFPVSSIANASFNASPANGIAPNNYCSSSNYSQFYYMNAVGNSDVFIAKALDLNRQPYDYYKRTGTGCDKSYVGVCINNCIDSVASCGSVNLGVNSNTATSLGPNFKYRWSTGAINPSINVNSSGYYSVTMTSEDACFTSKDTIYAAVYPVPSKPTISGKTSICTPDSTTIVFGNITSGTTHVLKGTGLPAAGIDTNAITTKVSSSYTYTVANSYGCSNSTSVSVNVQSAPNPLKEIVPKVSLLNDPDNNDSVGFCAGGNFQVLVYDSLTNPSGTRKNISNMTNINWSVSPSVSKNWGNPVSTFYPTSSGYYQLNGTITLSSSTSCGSSTLTYNVSKKVYVTVIPKPSVSIAIKGNSSLCPGTSDTLTATVTGATSYTWSGPGIIGVRNQSSIIVNQPGNYRVTANVTENGCSNSGSQTFSISNPTTTNTPPVVTMNPSNGLICPNDSVTLTTQGGLTYEWYDPSGIVIGTDPSVSVHTPGYYYCITRKTKSCGQNVDTVKLVSNTVEVKQFATPLLVATPSTFICSGSKATLTLSVNVGSTVKWDAPLSGSALTQKVDAAGVYTATVTSCGITNKASVTITSSNVEAKITGGPFNVCEGDSVTLYANKGMGNYKWTPGNSFNDSLVVKQAGTYTVKTTDGNGCSATSVPVSVTFHKKLGPPVASDVSICNGMSATLKASSSGTIEWYRDSTGTTKLSTGNQYITPVLTQKTTYYVQTPVAYCDTLRVPVNVNISAASFVPVIENNSPVCEGDTLRLGTSATQVAYLWKGPGNFTSNAQEIEIPMASAVHTGNYSLVLTGGGCTSPPSSTDVVVKKTPSAPLINNNSPLCEGLRLKLMTDTLQSDGTAIISYAWKGPNNFISSLQNPEISKSTLADSGTYSLEVTLDGCPSPETNSYVIVKQVPLSPNIVTNSPLCVGENIYLQADSISNVNYNWEGPAGFSSVLQNPVINSALLKNTGKYSVFAEMNGCSSNTKSSIVVVNPLPEVNIHNETIICPDEESLVLNPGNYESYLWQDYSTTPTYTVSSSGTYQLTVTNKFGCVASDTVVIKEGCPPSLYVPSAFTPNSDITNDTFNAKGTYLTSYRMRIFNRWGELIFETNDLNYGWDGTYKGASVQDGIYVWVIYAEGYEKDVKVNINRTGHVTLIR